MLCLRIQWRLLVKHIHTYVVNITLAGFKFQFYHLPATWPELWGMKLTYIKYSEWLQVHVHFMEVLLLFLNRKHSFILISSRSLIFYFLNFFLYGFYPWKIKLTTLKRIFFLKQIGLSVSRSIQQPPIFAYYTNQDVLEISFFPNITDLVSQKQM